MRILVRRLIGWWRRLSLGIWVSWRLSLLLGLLLLLLLSLLLSLLLLLRLLLGLLLSLLLGLVLSLLTLLAVAVAVSVSVDVDDDCRRGGGPEDEPCEFRLCNGLLISEQLRLQVEQRTRGEELAILLDECCVTDEQVLVRQDDSGWISEDLSIARSLGWLGTEGKQDRAVDLAKWRIGVELSNLRGSTSSGLTCVAHTGDTWNIQTCGRGGRADSQRLSRVHHDEHFLALGAIIRPELVDHIASVDVLGVSLVNDVRDCNNDSVHLCPSY